MSSAQAQACSAAASQSCCAMHTVTRVWYTCCSCQCRGCTCVTSSCNVHTSDRHASSSTHNQYTSRANGNDVDIAQYTIQYTKHCTAVSDGVTDELTLRASSI